MNKVKISIRIDTWVRSMIHSMSTSFKTIAVLESYHFQRFSKITDRLFFISGIFGLENTAVNKAAVYRLIMICKIE